MIVEKVIGNRKTFDIGDRQVEHVWLEWYELEKKLLRKKSESGEAFGIRAGEPLKAGDILFADENRIVAVEVLPCELTVVKLSLIHIYLAAYASWHFSSPLTAACSSFFNSSFVAESEQLKYA